MEVTIDTLEDMCSLMCDNYIPRREDKNGMEEIPDKVREQEDNNQRDKV